MRRNQVINFLIKKCQYSKYLEIGVAEGQHLESIKCELKDSVDPYIKNSFITSNDGPAKYKITSDDFFATIAPTLSYKYDIIFIDGLHEAQQVDKDIQNSLEYLNKNGSIVLHDCNPVTELSQRVPRASAHWNGDVWKSYVKLRMTRSDLEMYVVDTDQGCGVIRFGTQELYNNELDTLTWKNFNHHRKKMLNLINVHEFRNKFN